LIHEPVAGHGKKGRNKRNSHKHKKDNLKKIHRSPLRSLSRSGICVGTYDVEGKPNVMTASVGGELLFCPPCRSLFFERRQTYTYRNILEATTFTIAFPQKNTSKKLILCIASGKTCGQVCCHRIDPAKSEVWTQPTSMSSICFRVPIASNRRNWGAYAVHW